MNITNFSGKKKENNLLEHHGESASQPQPTVTIIKIVKIHR